MQHEHDGLDEHEHDALIALINNDTTHALEDAQRMVMMQGVTINALQNRIFHLEMEIVDLMSASIAGPTLQFPAETPRVTMTTPISRLFTKPITLIKRIEVDEDSWGAAVWEESQIEVLGYYQQIRTGDPDSITASVVFENIEVFLPRDLEPGPYGAVEIAIHGVVERMEIIGQPSEEWNARVGEVNHLKMLVRRSAP